MTGFAAINLALIDPPQWGWSAGGTVVNLATPQEKLKRLARRNKRRRSSSSGSNANQSSFLVGTTAETYGATNKSDVPSASAASAAAGAAASTSSKATATSANSTAAVTSVVVANPHQFADVPHLGCKSLVVADERNPKRLKVQALFASDTSGSDLQVDMYTYHCGREGFEFGDELEATDTGNNFMPGRNKVQILVKFPLGPGKEWRQVVEWSLTQTETTPFIYASEISHQFGLDLDQTLELANSIERQLETAIESTAAYPDPPVTLYDYYGNERPPSTRSTRHSQLYGFLSAQTEPGMPKKALTNKIAISSAAAAPPPPRPASLTGRLLARQGSSRGLEGDFQSLPHYRNEVLQRAQRECALWPSFELVHRWNHNCHLCNWRSARSCYIFPCGITTHAYCRQHTGQLVGQELGLRSAEMTTPHLEYDHCPICALTCSCGACKKRLDKIALELEEKTREQGTLPEDTFFGSILERQRNLPLNFPPRKLKPVPIRRPMPNARRMMKQVPKIPPTDFPAEIANGRDLEPGNSLDYRSIFTSHGVYLSQDDWRVTESNQDSEVAQNELPEDGNIDHCLVCKKAGNIICCDSCPRAFHAECMPDKVQQDSAKWSCHICTSEKAGLPEDVVTGKKIRGDGKLCIDAICEAFCQVDAITHGKEYLQAMQVLSMVLEMLDQLMAYDFGYMFAEPVDTRSIPEYTVLVPNPMDLGTISRKLVNGEYAKVYEENRSWDDVLVRVLQDIELVWHNCFTFNFEGSCIYRMAEVLSLRSCNIRKASLDSLLSDDVKNRVAEYTRTGQKRRSEMNNKVPVVQSKLKHQISATLAAGGKIRTVAVFDPATGRLVKLYSTLRNAWLAAQYLSSLGHASEWTPVSEHTVKQFIRRGGSDANCTLFGYRWVFFDELRMCSINFGDQIDNPVDQEWSLKSADLIQMTDGKETYLFLSISEAVSFSELPKDVSLAELAKRLKESQYNTWLSLAGFRWRKLPRNKSCDDVLDRVNSSPSGTAIVKTDSLTGRKLIVFDTVDMAFRDWVRCCEMSPSVPSDEDLSMETFQKLYIQASEQIDGLTWTVVPSLSELQNLKQAKHQAAISSLANQLGKRPPERETVPGTIQVTNQTEYAVESSVKEGGSSNQPSAGQANAGAAIPEDSGQQTSDEGQNEQVRPRGEKGYVFI